MVDERSKGATGCGKESNTENGVSLKKRRDVPNDLAEGRGAEAKVDGDLRDFDQRQRVIRSRGRREESSVLDHGLQVAMEIAAPFGRLGAVRVGGAVLRGGFELRGNAGRRAGRIQQKGQDEDERHDPFYFSRRGTMES